MTTSRCAHCFVLQSWSPGVPEKRCPTCGWEKGAPVRAPLSSVLLRVRQSWRLEAEQTDDNIRHARSAEEAAVYEDRRAYIEAFLVDLVRIEQDLSSLTRGTMIPLTNQQRTEAMQLAQELPLIHDRLMRAGLLETAKLLRDGPLNRIGWEITERTINEKEDHD